MKKIVHATIGVEPIGPLKRTSQAAEMELAHLESILLSISRTSLKNSALQTGYWQQRIQRIESDFILLPRQTSRLSRLSEVVWALDAQIASKRLSSTARAIAA